LNRVEPLPYPRCTVEMKVVSDVTEDVIVDRLLVHHVAAGQGPVYAREHRLELSESLST